MKIQLEKIPTSSLNAIAEEMAIHNFTMKEATQSLMSNGQCCPSCYTIQDFKTAFCPACKAEFKYNPADYFDQE